MKLLQLSKRILLASGILSAVIFFSGCTKSDAGLSVALSYSLNGSTNSSQGSNGSGTFTGTYNASTKVMTYTSTWTKLTGAPTGGGIYTTNASSGAISGTVATWNLGSGLSASGSFSSSTTLTAAQEADLLAGRMYYFFNTAAYASGEVRGQITATAQ